MTADGRYTSIDEMPLLMTKEEVAKFRNIKCVKTIQNNPKKFGGRKPRGEMWVYPRDLVLLAARVPMGAS